MNLKKKLLLGLIVSLAISFCIALFWAGFGFGRREMPILAWSFAGHELVMGRAWDLLIGFVFGPLIVFLTTREWKEEWFEFDVRQVSLVAGIIFAMFFLLSIVGFYSWEIDPRQAIVIFVCIPVLAVAIISLLESNGNSGLAWVLTTAFSLAISLTNGLVLGLAISIGLFLLAGLMVGIHVGVETICARFAQRKRRECR